MAPYPRKKYRRVYYNFNNMEENMAENIDGCVMVPDMGKFWGGGLLGGSQYRQVKIDKVANGFVIEIGCKKFVAEKWDDLAKKLGEYWKDPTAAEKKYCK